MKFGTFALIALLVGLRPPGVLAQQSAPVTEISLQRTWCYGVCPIDKLVLKSDGSALYTGKSFTRLTGQFTGTIWKGDYDLLAAWLVSSGFFDLKDRYGSPNVDQSSEVIRVVRGGMPKTVIDYRSNSEVLFGVERIIQGAVADIRWQPVKSGIRGDAKWKIAGEDARPLANLELLVYASDDKQEYNIAADSLGKFEIALLPGTYRIEAQFFGRSPEVATPPRKNPVQTVVVQADKFIDVSFQYERASGESVMAGGVTRTTIAHLSTPRRTP